MRYTNELGKNVKPEDAKYMGDARKLVGEVLGLMGNTKYADKQKRLPNGAIIECTINKIGMHPIIRTGIKSTSDEFSETEEFGSLDTGFLFYPHSQETDEWELSYAKDRGGDGWPDVLHQGIRVADGVVSHRIKTDAPELGGPITWFGYRSLSREGDLVVLSWDHGLPCRYRLSLGYEQIGAYRYSSDVTQTGFTAEFTDESSDCIASDVRLGRDGWLYVNGSAIPLVTGYPIRGAAVFEGRYIYVGGLGATAVFYYGYGGGWAELGTFSYDIPLQAPWFFSPTGTRAATVVERTGEGYQGDYSLTRFVIIRAEIFIDGEGALSVSFSEEDVIYQSPKLEVSDITATNSSAPDDTSCTGWQFKSINTLDYGTVYTSASVFSSISANVADYIKGLDSLYPDGSVTHEWVNTSEISAWVSNYISDLDLIECPAGTGDAYFNPIAAQIESSTGTPYSLSTAYYYTRTGWLESESTTGTQQHRTAASYGRVIAVDYDIDDNELILTEHRASFTASYETSETEHYREDRYHADDGVGYFGSTVIEVNQQIDRAITSMLVSSWEMRINGDVFLRVSGEASANGGNTFTHYHNTYTGESSENVASHGNANANYERIWLLDCDVRTRSAVYIQDENVESYDNLIYSTGFPFEQTRRVITRTGVVKHSGANHVLFRYEINKTPQGMFAPLYTGLPLMHGGNENVEQIYSIDPCFIGGTYPVIRAPGSMVLRTPNEFAVSISNESGRNTTYGDYEELKYYSFMSLGEYVFSPKQPIADALGAAPTMSLFRLNPIRAV